MRKKRTSLWAATLLVFSPFVAGQQASQQPNSPPLPSVLGPQLVAWSDLQKPQPVPQPLPPPQRADQSLPAPSHTQQQPSTQTFTGTIVKDNNKYVLKVSDGAVYQFVVYQIDDQEKAKLYEGKQVKIAGSLDAKTYLLHIVSIEPVS